MAKCEYRSLPDQRKARSRVEKPSLVLEKREVPSTLKTFAAGRKYYIRTFGCQANVRDEETLAGYLEMAGFTKTEVALEADLVLINTCAVRENAEEKVYGEIGTFKASKDRNPSFILAVCGCMMQEEGKAEEIEARYPYVSLVFGTHNIHDILTLLNEVVVNKKNLVDVKSFPGDIVENMPSVRLDPYRAYVNIAYGCDKFCTYCIVPYTRGRERSRSEEEILNECRALVAEGYKEITLLGQNVNSYGRDLDDGSSFASLLAKVAQTGIPRLRFLTSYPSQFTDETIATMARYPSIVKWLHLPVQSGSDEVLKRMGRRYTRKDYLSLVGRLRFAMPNIALTTDIIVGFPNETENEFADTLSLCQEVDYSAAFTFIYSPRKGTPAASIADDVSDEAKHKRFDRLVEVVEHSTSEHSLAMVGKTFEVLVEGPSKRDDEVLSGYAENGKLINFRGPRYLTGCFVPVKVKESHTYSLLGELLGDPLILKAQDASSLLKREANVAEYLRFDEAIRSDLANKELADRFTAAKKKMVREMGDKTAYLAAKEEYESILKQILGNPLLHNREQLRDSVESTLIEVKEALK
jgi:tRNA-2-methylthio-N6-dimethylallyladenosine synthase